MSARWGILGGGMLGLTLAYDLARRGENVTLVEGQSTLGGLTAQWRHGDIGWDRFYHVIESGDSHLRQLLQEIDLEREIVWGRTRTNFFDGRALYPLNNAVDFARLPVLGPHHKVRLALTILRATLLRDVRALDHLTATQWLRSWSGEATYRRLWYPLLRSKLGANTSLASAAYLCSVIQRFHGAREGAKQQELFGYVAGGYGRIITRLTERLVQSGVTIVTAAPIRQVAASGSAIAVDTGAGAMTFDRAVITLPSPVVSRLCPGLAGDPATRHAEVRYQGVVCPSLLLSRPLGGAYLTYITDDTVPFTTVIEMSSLTSPQTYHGRHLVYLPKYVPADDPIFDESDELIENQFIAGLERLFPDLHEDHILVRRTARACHVMAVPTVGYASRVPGFATGIPGLAVCNSAQIVNAALSVNESVRHARDFLATSGILQ